MIEGQIDLVRWTEAGRAVRIHVARAGQTFAEASIYADACHCDAVAAAPTTLRLVPRKVALQAFAASPELARAFTIHLAQSLMAARRLLELRAITPLSRRALVRLTELADANGVLPEGMRLSAIASDLGVTAPAFYRAIAGLEKAGALDRPNRGRIRLSSQV